MNNIIYLDNNATTKTDPRVFDAMAPYFTEFYGNASSNHTLGVYNNNAVNRARLQLAELINCNDNEIVFTSGATEAINLALKGIVGLTTLANPRIITVQTEHPAVLDTCAWLEKKGVDVVYLKVDSKGLIDLNELEASITPETILISVMYVNNETGVIQPMQKIAELAHKNNILFMSDATQAVGKIPISVRDIGIDILCFSGHKFYGPKGVGGIYLRSKRPFKPKVEPLLHGGGHENGIRSGTLNVPGIVGLGKAAEICKSEMKQDIERINKLRKTLELQLLEIPESFINGSLTNRIYSTTNICFKGVDADAILASLKNIAVSNGSACSSSSIEPSHVLMAMGLSDSESFSSIRFSFGKYNTENDIKVTIKTIIEVINNLCSFSL